MGRPFVVGLTGGMGAGKSTVVAHMRHLPAFEGNIFDCDAMVHRLYKVPAMRAWLEEKFGAMPEDTRAHCAKMVQGDPPVLDELERMFIAALKIELNEFLQISADCGTRYVFVDAPLLFETNFNRSCDSVVVITCPEEVRRKRILERPSMSETTMNRMLARQFSEEERIALADYCINTDTTLDETFAQVAVVHDAIRSRANGQA